MCDKKKQAINKIVDLSEVDRLELFGYLLAKYPEIYDTIIEFNPSQRCLKVITKEMIIENGWSFEEIIDNADDNELKLIEACNGDLTMLLDNLQITGVSEQVQFLLYLFAV